jgi:hypothetical protein
MSARVQRGSALSEESEDTGDNHKHGYSKAREIASAQAINS